MSRQQQVLAVVVVGVLSVLIVARVPAAENKSQHRRTLAHHKMASKNPPRLNLVWTVEDPNGLPLNPSWPSSDVPRVLAGIGWETALPKLSDQRTTIDPPPPQRVGCAIANSQAGSSDPRTVALGHLDWIPVAVMGHVLFADFGSPHWSPLSQDFDLDFYQWPSSPLPMTRGNIDWSRAHGRALGNQKPFLEAELYHYESTAASLFSKLPTWRRFLSTATGGHRAVKAANRVIQSQNRSGRQAIVTGLFGLDVEHGGKAEVHPIYSIALPVATDSNSDTETWIFLIRNYGDEGWCGTREHFWHAADGGSDRHALLIPWRRGANGVDVAGDARINRGDSGTPRTIEVESIPRYGVVLWCPLEAPENYSIVAGEVTLRWRHESKSETWPNDGDPAEPLMQAWLDFSSSHRRHQYGDLEKTESSILTSGKRSRPRFVRQGDSSVVLVPATAVEKR